MAPPSAPLRLASPRPSSPSRGRAGPITSWCRPSPEQSKALISRAARRAHPPRRVFIFAKAPSLERERDERLRHAPSLESGARTQPAQRKRGVIQAVQSYQPRAWHVGVWEEHEPVGADAMPVQIAVRRAEEEAGTRRPGCQRDCGYANWRRKPGKKRPPRCISHVEVSAWRPAKQAAHDTPYEPASSTRRLRVARERRSSEWRLDGNERPHVGHHLRMQRERGMDVERAFALPDEHHGLARAQDCVADARSVV